MSKANISLVVFLFIIHFCCGQSPIYTLHEHYDTERGIPQGQVTAIEQDDDGFIWISTLDGLARFDGKSFLHFKGNEENEERRLTNSLIFQIHYDQHGFLWVLYFNYKVDRIDTKTLKVNRDVPPSYSISAEEFQLQIKFPDAVAIMSDMRGNWYAGGKGSYHLYDTSNLRLRKFFTGFEKTTNYIYGFDEDPQGNLWVMTEEGLQVSDKDWENFRELKVPDSLKYSTPKLTKQRPVISQKDKVVLMNLDQLLVYDRVRKSFRKLAIPKGPLSKENEILRCATVDKSGNIFFAYQGFVFRLNNDLSIDTIWKLPENEILRIDNILIDKSEALWVATNGGGLYKVNMNTPGFVSSKYEYNLPVDVLMGVLNISDKDVPENWKEKNGSYGLRYAYFDDHLILSNEYLYGDDRRVYAIKGASLQQIESLHSSLEYVVGITTHNDSLFALDKGGNLLAWSGLNESPIVREVIPVPFSSTQEEGETVKKPKITEINLKDLESGGNDLWAIATHNQLYQIRHGRLLQVHELPLEEVNLIDLHYVRETPDVLWIATLGKGLVKWNIKTNQIEKIYSQNNGLSNNNVAFIKSDKRGNLWLGSFNGLCRFNPEKESFTSYSTKEGLLESEFNRHHVLQLPDGRLVAGGTFGYTVFDPSLFKADFYKPEITISGFSINDTKVSETTYPEHAKQPIKEQDNLELSYDQNSLRFELAVMQYNDPDKNLIRYQLIGYNKSWVNNENQRTVRFDNLRPGHYTLKLNATNTDGKWSDKITRLNITIHPPPWLSWWAYALYFVAAVLIIYFYWKSYKKRLYRQQEIEFNKREAARLQEIDDIKTRFFSNITHEFRTPLTLILSPLERELREKSHSKEVIRILEGTYRQGNHLLKLVNQLLDISKLESGSMMFHKSAGDLNAFVKALVDQFQLLANDQGIRLSFSMKGVEGNYLFDKSHLEKIIINLVGNAIKFTPEGGQIDVALAPSQANSQQAVSIKVVDTGVGIPAEKIPRLFDRFYQADDSSTRQQEGTGIGLSLVKELADLMEATISVESEEGKGTTFELILPTEKLSMNDGFKRSQVNALPGDKEPLILVVEDNDELRDFIVDSLSSDRKVIVAENGVAGWSLIEKHLPDIIISDVMMPEMDGYELCKKVKGDPRTNHIGVILLTAKTAQTSKEAGLECGADDYMTKPFHSQELELRIKNTLVQQERLKEKLRKQLLPSSPPIKVESPKDIFLSGLYQFLEENHTNTKLDVAEIAEAMNMSKSTLNRKLQSILKVSALNLIKQYRLQKAASLLKSGESISAAAYSSGFESPSYFTLVFKEAYGTTPTDFKKAS
ncbi:ATP-binding protein [Ekhidna sp. MALMAid0563]|uniref:hybrid sensor histidine kinase/response regulator transcription factor n=1 Tax=Ekhidna sp. MALMAid0563 TaxID=3143937 RepID=UPI0032DEDBA2